jgi:xylulokinase
MSLAAGSLVAGIDSSTQSCKVVIRHAEWGAQVRAGTAPHPDGTEIDPAHWARALTAALDAAGGLADVEAVSVAAQQHGMVALDDQGQVVRPALLWNDTRSAGAATDLLEEFGGPQAWAEAVGSVPLASFTVTKLRWLAAYEKANARRTAAVCLPHDWLTWLLAGEGQLDTLATDRSDASGTGYWSSRDGYRSDIVELALGHVPMLPAVLGPTQSAGETEDGALLGPGAGDNAAAALGLDLRPGDAVVSLGTSGVACAVSEETFADASGVVAGFADASGRQLPLVCTLNAARVLDAAARLLSVDLPELARLALSAPPGADGLTVVPYLQGERTPDRPYSAGAVHGLTLANSTPAHLARAAVEGMLCGLADALDALAGHGVAVDRIVLIGGGARNEAVCRIAPSIFERPVTVPDPAEHVAIGAARQAAWTLLQTPEPPAWTVGERRALEAAALPEIRERYAGASTLTVSRLDAADPRG